MLRWHTIPDLKSSMVVIKMQEVDVEKREIVIETDLTGSAQ
ncbi:MAG: hypothetical protein ACYTBZ_12155 [Planctomycetota bacterium]|jgi:hypothetical protein